MGDPNKIHSFDESSVTGSYTGAAEHLGVRGITRTNSCQSDSSGFLEEPFIPSLSQHATPGPELIKALSGLSGGSTDSQTSERPASPSPSVPPSPLFSPSLTSSSVDKPPLPPPSPSPVPPSVFSPSPSPVFCLPKPNLQNSETGTPLDQDQSLTIQSPRLSNPDPVFPFSLSATSSPTPPGGSEKIKTGDEHAPDAQMFTFCHESEGTAHSNASRPASTSSDLNSLFSTPTTMSSTQSGSPEKTEVSLHENSLSDSSLLPSDSSLPPSAHTDVHCQPSLASPPLTESISESLEHNNFPVFLSPDSETPSPLSFQLDNPSALSYVNLDSSEFEGFPTLPCLSPNPSSSQSHSDGLTDPSVGRLSGLTEQSVPQQDGPCCHVDNTDCFPDSPVRDVIKMNHLSLDVDDTHQRNGKGETEDERHADTVQTPEAVVYISDTESYASLSEGSRLVSEEVCNQTEIDPQVPSWSLHDELSTGTQPEDCQREINGLERESLRSSDVQEPHSRTEVEPKGLIQIESLDLVFQTSVDGSEGDNGEVDAFFQQLDTEGRAYWAEPIQVSNSTPEESASFEDSDRCPGNTDQTSQNGSASLDNTSSSPQAPFPPPSARPHLKPSSRSVSVQMSSSLSSHIVQRKDVPYTTDSKRTLLPNVLPLDTSTPFRAVQSWTDLQIQRNTLTNKLPHEAPYTVPKEETVPTSATETTQSSTLNFSSSPYFPGMATNGHMSVSVDKGLWPDEEEVDRIVEEKLWEGDHIDTMACCCSCDHLCTCCTHKQHNLGNIPYSLDELEEMMVCLQQFRSVLSNMEEQLSEDQAAVYSALSEQDRNKVRDIEDLRLAVKQEAAELEMQLNELAHHYDNSLKMKMHRLLDEQSTLCSQLRVFLPGATGTSSNQAPSRTVAVQCCLLPWSPPADGPSAPSAPVSSWSTWNPDSLREAPPGSECICEGLDCSPSKADKLDMMGFLQRVLGFLSETTSDL
ncbi:uncharacterized protein LOC131962408 [Centropristis striata]|uniref:uncharacterized protein LOC131962408 n=1 Tax=Centropristis striata TaxID=184440 RepID=UPI0027DF87E7|nr:uncharacterized protein LOC131962408 [Centropristis striata]